MKSIMLTFVLLVTTVRGGISDGLVAYYPFNGNANDSTAGGHNGSVVGAVLTADRLGAANSAYYFDGVNDFIGTGLNITPSSRPTCSISFWAKPLSPGGWRQHVISCDDGNYDRAVLVAFNGWEAFVPGWYVWRSPFATVSGAWQHVVVTYSGASLWLYVNGVRANCASNTSDGASFYGMHMGKNPGFGEYYHGALDEVRVYNRTLSDAEVLELYGAGQPDWSRMVGTPSWESGGHAAADGAGNVYLCGWAYSAVDSQPYAGEADFLLVKFNGSGVKQWTRLWGTPTNDSVRDAGCDTSGNVYVCGATQGSFDSQSNAGGYDMFLSKYNSAGTCQWTRIFGSAGGDSAYNVHVGSDGNIYVGGVAGGGFDGQTALGGSDFCVRKFNSAGTKQWTRIWGSTQDDRIWRVAADGAGNVYAVGDSYAAVDGQPFVGYNDPCLTKFSASGTKQWTRMWGSTAGDYARGLYVDSAGSAYVCGYTDGAFDGQVNTGLGDIFLKKYSPAGAAQWTRIWGSPDYDVAMGIAARAPNELYLAGCTRDVLDGQPHLGDADACLICCDTNGVRAWTRTWGSAAYDGAEDIDVDDDSAFVAGATWGAFGGQTHAGVDDLFVTKFTLVPEPGATLLLVGLMGLSRRIRQPQASAS